MWVNNLPKVITRQPGYEPGPPDPETDALTTQTPRLIGQLAPSRLSDQLPAQELVADWILLVWCLASPFVASLYEVIFAFVYHVVVSSWPLLLQFCQPSFGTCAPSITTSSLWWCFLAFFVVQVHWFSLFSPCLSMRYAGSCETTCCVLPPNFLVVACFIGHALVP